MDRLDGEATAAARIAVSFDEVLTQTREIGGTLREMGGTLGMVSTQLRGIAEQAFDVASQLAELSERGEVVADLMEESFRIWKSSS